jgi:hypothetical protein
MKTVLRLLAAMAEYTYTYPLRSESGKNRGLELNARRLLKRRRIFHVKELALTKA